MSAAANEPSPSDGERLLSGWGRAPVSRARVVKAHDGLEATAALAAASATGERLIGRGLGRSYGDAAQVSGGVVVDLTGATRLLCFDGASGVVTAEAGLSIDTLLRTSVPEGWFVPVTPGTRQVTLAGALAADVHGKNHHVDGSFAGWVERFKLATAAGTLEVSKERESDVFWATAGGMGLTGLVLDLTLQLIPIESSAMVVDTERAADLDDCMARMEERDAEYRYSVAWIDCLARGRHVGRSVLTRGEHATSARLEGAGRAAARFGPGLRAYDPRELASVPLTPPVRLLSRKAVAAFNEAWFRKSPKEKRGEIQSIQAFFHPLDGVREWNRLYGPRGFTQYQFVVPSGAEETLRSIVGSLSSNQVPSFL
ncbi:MAG: FAD-binding oxidoreductase, partial [Actinomycetota bacterium]|nr:FAD-binding oxidoreductase [Actinomycetota bacterium]